MKNEIDIIKHCDDFFEWPERWKMMPDDVTFGEEILKEMIPFIKFLILKNYTKKTLKKHLDNIWLLGGELIDRINMDDELREITAIDLILKYIDSSGGPYSKHLDSEYALDSFDSTCRKYYKFLKDHKKI